MARETELSGVAHNIAHHSCSGLSYISPHLAKALRAVGLESTQINLLDSNPYPSKAEESEPLRMGLESLHKFVLALLERHGFSKESVSSIVLFTTAPPWDIEGYSIHTRAVITSKKGRVYDSGWLR